MVVTNHIPTDNAAGGVRLGLVRASGVSPGAYPPDLDQRLAAAVADVVSARLPEDFERRRLAARDMLRNGRYKPTGRGKPASEYLVRATGGDFPRINSLVDVNNLVSLEEALPISMWDLQRVSADHLTFRLGRPGEEYVFNQVGQALDVEDLVVGCRVTTDSPKGEPVVSPIKDSQLAKTHGGTHSVAACVYAPMAVVSDEALLAICERFAELLSQCGRDVSTSVGVVGPGASVRL